MSFHVHHYRTPGTYNVNTHVLVDTEADMDRLREAFTTNTDGLTGDPGWDNARLSPLTGIQVFVGTCPCTPAPITEENP